ncbi:MAG: GH92 family glycosyl hydrolase, partial [Bacteroidota bacterium]|nr:GH92 family glycosyl hydrolase [Bacteroidota bacterium]
MKKRFYSILIFIIVINITNLFVTCSPNNSSDKDYSKFVNPLVGTGWHGHTFPGATHPFGMVQLSPDTRVDTWDGCSGYHYSDHSILGFSHTHFSGTGGGGGGDIMLMPTVGEIQLDTGSVSNTLSGYRSKFSHREEFAEPGYYKVKLQDDDIVAELTSTLRVGFHKYTFPSAKDANVILDLTHGISDEVDSLHLEIVSDTEISGFRESYEGLAGNHKMFFIAKFSQPFKKFGVYRDGEDLGQTKKSGSKDLQAYFQFDTENGNPVMIKVALSRVGADGARKNMEAELPEWDFDAVKNAAREAWNKELGKIEVKGRTKTQIRTFYTAMYHSFIHPDIDVDVDRQFLGGDHKVYRAKDFDNYTTFSLWDTFRALHPLYTIIQQQRTNQFIRSFLEMYDHFGSLPMMEFSGNERFAMIGYHSLPVIADAYEKGIRDYDVNKALEAMKKLSNSNNRAGKKEYLKIGFIPYEKYSQSVSRTLEYSYDDWTVTRLAKDLSDADFHLYNQRGQFYRNLYDQITGFMRPRSSDYQWLGLFDPLAISNHFTEGNAYQYSLFVPQDIEGLIELMGGDNKFEQWLDICFTTEMDTTKTHLADVTGRIGQYAQGNEPSHHMAYLYNYAGAPWKTQQLVRQIMDTLYSDQPDGISGNEDAGQMSAWYVLSAMGFYSVTPGMDYYVIGSPL